METYQMKAVTATRCVNCGTTTTPLWRRDPNGETICNACGLYLKARHTLRPPTLKRAPKKQSQKKKQATTCTSSSSSSSSSCSGTCLGAGQCNGTGGSSACAGCPTYNQNQINRQALICANCRTNTTPLWRRDDRGNTICNACGLYFKLHNMHRPVTMKRSMVKRRKRISVAQGYSDDEPEEEFRPQLPLKRTIENRVPEIEDYMIKRPSLLSPQENVLPKTPPNHYLFSKFPEESTECPPPPMRENPLRLESLFNPKEDCSMLPSLTLPPLMYQGAPSPPMSQASSQASTQTSPSQTSVTQSSMTQQREYDLADFDAALDKIEHLRRQVRPEQAYALSQLTQSITELASRAEAVLEHY